MKKADTTKRAQEKCRGFTKKIGLKMLDFLAFLISFIMSLANRSVKDSISI